MIQDYDGKLRCEKCGGTMRCKNKASFLHVCRKCGQEDNDITLDLYENPEDYDDAYPECCAACGNEAFPRCMDSCDIFDD